MSLYGLAQVLAAYLFAHAETIERLGTDRPEMVNGSSHELIDRLDRQRKRVVQALTGDDPAAVAKHVKSLTKGMRLSQRISGRSKGTPPPC
jgi:hypothetical protein